MSVERRYSSPMQQLQHFWPLILIMAISAVSWILQRLKEQAAIKKAKEAQERRKLEELRTGRALDAPPGPERPDQAAMQDLAARRQAQLRELRARQQQQQAGVPIPPARRSASSRSGARRVISSTPCATIRSSRPRASTTR